MIDVASLTWRALKGWAEVSIHDLHLLLENPALLPEATAQIRGQISALRIMIALGDAPELPVPVAPVPDGVPY